MTPALIAFLIISTIELSITMFFVIKLWQHTYTNLDNQVKMQIELYELLRERITAY